MYENGQSKAYTFNQESICIKVGHGSVNSDHNLHFTTIGVARLVTFATVNGLQINLSGPEVSARRNVDDTRFVAAFFQ
uniref:Uncharacterized protein n=1 Tax=Romanomermis culicivorax TaxID=13658 RepID=A0A915K054_ROMCU